ncbi:hypothetical protein SARC_11775, partial [Sphaeroforma arctica JP610]
RGYCQVDIDIDKYYERECVKHMHTRILFENNNIVSTTICGHYLIYFHNLLRCDHILLYIPYCDCSLVVISVSLLSFAIVCIDSDSVQTLTSIWKPLLYAQHFGIQTLAFVFVCTVSSRFKCTNMQLFAYIQTRNHGDIRNIGNDFVYLIIRVQEYKPDTSQEVTRYTKHFISHNDCHWIWEVHSFPTHLIRNIIWGYKNYGWQGHCLRQE